jgi:hypothetical protein
MSITNVKYIINCEEKIIDVFYAQDGREHHLVCPINVKGDTLPKPTNKEEPIIREFKCHN